MVEPSADNTCMTDIENVDADTDVDNNICDKKEYKPKTI
jgi:hypothetical protein